MTKRFYTMTNVITFEVDENRLSEVNSATDAFAKEIATITQHEVILINPDGTLHQDEIDKIAIKQAITYGLMTKG